jgi:hypothetical protein
MAFINKHSTSIKHRWINNTEYKHCFQKNNNNVYLNYRIMFAILCVHKMFPVYRLPEIFYVANRQLNFSLKYDYFYKLMHINIDVKAFFFTNN